MQPDVLIVGAGFAGAVIAERMASIGKKVEIIEKRPTIGGNAYDYVDENKVNRHEYGPHIFHTNSKKVVDYLSNFTSWYPYEHRVLGKVNGKTVPIPFNLTSIDKSFDAEKADHLKKTLIEAYGLETKVPILKLRQNEDPEIQELAEYIYEHVFKYYTMKQWGLTPEQIDPKVTERVPVLVSTDDRYFQDTYQQMPKEGYTKIFENMLTNDNIIIHLNMNANDIIKVMPDTKEIYYDGQKFDGILIYTGMIDELLDYRLGELPYRSLYFDVQTHDGTYQEAATVNYPTPEAVNGFTRITEYKLLMDKPTQPSEKTTIAVEYPLAYARTGEKGNIPYYPIFTQDNQAKYEAYVNLVKDMPNLVLLGRLAEYRYYNMDAIIEKALDTFEKLK